MTQAVRDGLELTSLCQYCGAHLWLWRGVKSGVYVKCERGHNYLISIRDPVVYDRG